jgi:hypothetical protein
MCADWRSLRVEGQPSSAGYAPHSGTTRAKNRLFPGRFAVDCGSGPEVALGQRRKADNVAQRMIEILIGRLITDEQFRLEFLDNPERTLLGLCARGLELSRTEIAALVGTDPTLWARTADAIDPRLQKASLKNEARIQ